MNIEIAFDFYKIDREKNSFAIETKDDYIKSRFLIRDAVEKDSDIRLVIKNKGMREWFKDIYKYASFKNISPVEELKRLLRNNDVPQALIQNPKKIVELKLIEHSYNNPIKPEQTVLDWVLDVTVKFPWIREGIKEGGDVLQVLEWLIKNRFSSIDEFLIDLCIEKIDFWKLNSPFKEFLEWLKPSIFERAYLFCLCQLLQNYPESQKALWLQPDGQWSIFCQLPNYTKWLYTIPPLDKLDIDQSLSINIRDYIQKQLNQKGLVIDVIKELSGKLNIEEDTISQYIENLTDKSIQPEVISALQDKFKDGELKDTILRLKSVPPPPTISDDFEIKGIFEWMQKHYFPYRTWCRTVDKEDLLDEYIEKFENWIIKNYGKLLSIHPEIFVCSIMKTIHSLIQDGASVLLVIVDSLSLQWADYIISKANGFCLEREPEVRLSMLPSVSEISKPAIISGPKLTNTIDPNSLTLDYYTQLLKKTYNKYVGDKIVATDSTDTLISLLQEDSNVYLYLFNEIDSIIHDNKNDGLRDSKIKKRIDDLLDGINYAIEKYKRVHKNKLNILITGDHGYLPLPKHSKQIPIDESVNHHHHRVLDKEIEECHIVKLQNQTYYITKGFNIVGRTPKGCVHGGLTPDELAVPFLVFSTIPPASSSKPNVTISGEIKRGYSECPLSVNITNPNPYKLSILEIEISFAKPCSFTLPLDIPKDSTVNLKHILDASEIKDEEIKLKYKVKTRCLGKDNITRDEISLKTIGAAIADKSFEEEFSDV